MSNEPFDPYQNWLGVSTPDRSPNHYELLQLDDFESDLKKINAAVERQAAILQLVTGDEVETAKRLLVEVGQARLCLVSETRKQEYDARLRKEIAGNNSQAIGPVTSINDTTLNSNNSSQSESSVNDVKIEGVRIVTDSEPSKSKGKAGASVDQTAMSSPTNLAGFSGVGADLQSERIESQKVKEKQDETIKLIMDKVLWISCGICLIAIVGVFISRSGGCNREPIVSDVDGESPQRSFSRKMNAEQKLNGGFKSKIFTESEKAKLLEQGNDGTSTSLDEP